MKKRILCLLVMCVTLFALTSCIFKKPDGGGGEKDPPSGDTGGTTDVEGVVFSPEVSASVIKARGDETLDLKPVTEKLFSLTGKLTLLNTDASSPEKHEIIFGNTSRELSSEALSLLDKRINAERREAEDANSEYTDIIGFGFYSDSNSLAIVYRGDSASELALTYFLENFLTAPTLILEDGYFYYEVFSLLEYKEDLEQAGREEMFEGLYEKLPAQTVDALKNYYSMFDDRYYIWMANLYDPGEYDENGNPYGGGFYYSNSGRDTPAYGIDLESTYQALSMLASSGMLANYSGNNIFKEAIPEKIQKEIIAFVHSCQSPLDGYYYHPQWESVTVSRRGRDLDWGTGLLERFGEKPYWNTPNGVKGTYGAPGSSAASMLTERLGGSSVISVSRLVPTANSQLPKELQTLDNFKAYLESFTSSMGNSSYSNGNTLGAIATQIAECGEEYIKAFETWANGLQNPTNGTWESSVHYNSINGLMKMSGTYNQLGIKLNYAKEALYSALKMVLNRGEDSYGKLASNSVDVWNPFCAITNIMTNVNEFGGEDVLNEFNEYVKEHSLEIVQITTEKNAQFRKDDGSFGYSSGTVGPTSQGAPVAVAGTYEGDINGGNIAVTGVSNYMCRILGIDVIPIFYPTDFERYLKIITELGPVLKEEVTVETKPITFDDEDVGTEKPGRVSTHKGLGMINVATDPRGEEYGNVLRFTTVEGGYSAISVSPLASRQASAYVAEFDVLFEEVNTQGTVFQIKIGKSYMLTLNVKGDKVEIGDASSEDGQRSVAHKFGVYFNVGEWAKIRVEHYPANTEDEVRTKIYLNGNLVVVSDNYKGQPVSGSAEPVHDFAYIEFYALQSTDMTVLFDNLDVKKTGDAFHLKDGTALVKYFFDNSEVENLFGTLGGGKYSSSDKTDGYSDKNYSGLVGDSVKADTVTETSNDFLRLEKTGAGEAYAKLLRGRMLGSLYVFETDIRWLSGTAPKNSEIFDIEIVSSHFISGASPMLSLSASTTSDGVLVLKLHGVDEEIATLKNNFWHSLRIEAIPLTKTEGALLVTVFVDGEEALTETVNVSDKSLTSDFLGAVIRFDEGAYGYKLDLDNTYKGVAVTTSHPEIEYGYQSKADFEEAINSEFVTQKTVGGAAIDSIFELISDPKNAANRVLSAYYPSDSKSEYAGYTEIKNSGDTGKDALYSSLSADVFFDPQNGTGGGRVSRLIFRGAKYFFGIDLFVIRTGDKYNLKASHYGRPVANTDSEGPGTGMETIFQGVEIDGWFNLRIDYCKSGLASVVSIYVNGVCYAKDVVCYYAENNITVEGQISSVDWRYIKSDVVTYLDNLSYECREGSAVLDFGTDGDPTVPDGPTTPDEPSIPNTPAGGSGESSDENSSMIGGGWTEKEN